MRAMPSGGRIYRQAALQFSVRGSAANLQSRCGRRVPTLLPIARRPTPFTDRIVLALELAGLCAAEVALPSLSPGQDMPGADHGIWFG
jgi:hypothetical protein